MNKIYRPKGSDEPPLDAPIDATHAMLPDPHGVFRISDAAYSSQDILAIWKDGCKVAIQLRGIQSEIIHERESEGQCNELLGKGHRGLVRGFAIGEAAFPRCR